MNTQKNIRPTRSKLNLAVAVAMASIAASSALADPLLTVKLFRDADIMFRDNDMSRYADNYVELGAGYNSNDSYRFGQFSGLYEKGPFAIANVNWQERKDGNDARYWSVFGSNRGLDSRRFRFDTGEQGLWNGYFGIDQLTKSETDSAQFTHAGLGTNTLTQLCADVANAAAVTPGCMTPFGIQQQRDILRTGASVRALGDWEFKLDYREDRRDGTRLTGFYFTAAEIVPYHTNDKTQQIESLISYTTQDMQWQLGYQYSKFSNNDPYFQVENPFTTSNGNDIGRMSLMPDNDYHQVHTSAAYNFSRQTRLTGQVSYGIGQQNEPFMAYSTALASQPSPASLDGKLVQTTADVALISKPMDRLSTKLAYQYIDKDNQTPINTYQYYSRDTTTTNTVGNVRRNAPLSSTEHKLSADADYQVADRTHLRTVLERRNTQYKLADRSETNTDRISLELRRPVSDEFLGALGYTYTQRTGSDYYKNTFFENSYPNMQASGFTNHPSMRQFLWNDYRENRGRISGNWVMTETVSLQAVVDGYHQRASGKQNCSALSATQDNSGAVVSPLPDTCLGRDLAAGGSVNFDVQWQPEENFTTFAFVNYAQTATETHGRQWSSSPPDTTNPGNSLANDWFANITMRDAATGAGFKWQPAEAWDIGGTYVLATGHGDVRHVRNSGTAPTDFPDTRSRLHTLQLFVKWDATASTTWRVNYVAEVLRSSDYMYDNAVAAPGTGNTSVLYTGRTSPEYINHVIGVSVAIKRW